MRRFVSDHLKTVDMCKNAAKKLSFVIRSVPDWYKSQKMCDKAILETGGTLKSVPDCCKNKKMCNQADDIYLMHYNLFPIALRLKNV